MLAEKDGISPRHCEERSDAAIHSANADRRMLWIAAPAFGLLAMTAIFRRRLRGSPVVRGLFVRLPPSAAHHPSLCQQNAGL